nr:putative reverse transcriptase domain-containing protein [Tanacetum cinerariifolium]
FRGAESYIERESRLTVISCSKVQEYRAKGCHVFLAQIFATKEDDKPEGKQVKDVPFVQYLPEVFPENFPGLPLARPVEFQIDLILGAAPVARAPYHLAPSEMKKLSKQLQELSDKEVVQCANSGFTRGKQRLCSLLRCITQRLRSHANAGGEGDCLCLPTVKSA